MVNPFRKKRKPIPKHRQCGQPGCEKEGTILFEICRRSEGMPQRNSEVKLCADCMRAIAASMDLPMPGDSFTVDER